ncbi:MAG: DUF4302 domain-containing protein [Paludibacteraceae bacterium]|nr:DUF4302 domain-containing protein [Paludibacteraceae bacterium]
MKAKYLLIGLALASVLCACNRDEESLFDRSAAERAQDALNNANTVLVSPANGWEMLYFANTDSRGYNLIVKFDSNGRVSATAKNALTTNNQLKTDVSTWDVKLDYGPILTFDTYNEVLHAWADPQTDGNGYLGDYEFLILSATSERVVLKGKKHSAYTILRPMPDMTPDDYFQACADGLTKYFGNGNILTLQQGDKLFYLHNGASGLFNIMEYGQKAATEDPENYPICPTLDGFMMSYGFNDQRNERLYTFEGDKFVGESGSIISSGDLNQLFMTYIDVNKGWTANLTSSTGAFAEAVSAFQSQLVSLTSDNKAKVNSVAITYSDTVFRYAGAYILRIKYEYKNSSNKKTTLVADFAVNVSNTEKAGHIVVTLDKPANETASVWYANPKADKLPELVATVTNTFTLSADDALNPTKALKLTDDKSTIVMSGSSSLK